MIPIYIYMYILVFLSRLQDFDIHGVFAHTYRHQSVREHRVVA